MTKVDPAGPPTTGPTIRAVRSWGPRPRRWAPIESRKRHCWLSLMTSLLRFADVETVQLSAVGWLRDGSEGGVWQGMRTAYTTGLYNSSSAAAALTYVDHIAGDGPAIS